jgi:hypothetical protein
MQKWNGTLLRKFDDVVDGNASTGTPVVVRNTTGNTIAIVYDVDDINSVQKNNPFVTDDFGRYSFYAPNGKYTIEFGDGSDSIDITLVDNITHGGLLGVNSTGGHDPIYSRNFKTVANAISGIDATGQTIDMTQLVGNYINIRGYHTESDGGSIGGVVRSGAHTSLLGEIITINANTYIEIDKSLPATLRRFGGGTDGETGITPTTNANAIEALFAYGTRTGNRIYSGTVGNFTVSRGLVCELNDGALDWFGTKKFRVIFSSNSAHVMDIKTRVGESHSAGVTLDAWNTKGGLYGTRIRAGDFGNNLLTVVDKVEVKNSYVTESYLSGFYGYHCQNIDVHHNIYHKCGDNGAYIAFCKAASASYNYVYNCRGSAGITMGYSDTIKSSGIDASHNIIWNDDSAASVPTASSTTSLGGVWMGHCENGKVHSNTIFNLTEVAGAKIKHGIWVDENTIKNVVIEENIITNMPENGIWVGSMANAIINDVYIQRNHIKFCRDGVRVTRGGDVYVIDNTVKFSSQRGVIAEAGSKSVTIDNNKLIVCGQQETFNTFFNVENLSDRPVTTNNTFDDTIAYIVLKDSSGNVTVKVDSATSVIEFFVSGVSTYTVTVNRKSSIWGDVHAAIIAIPALSLSTFVGQPNQIVESIKRSGPPNQSFATTEPANDYVLSFSPPWGYIKSSGVVTGNKLLSRYMSAKITGTNLYDSQKPCSVTASTRRDTNNSGGGVSYLLAARPTTGYYRQGDKASNKLDGGTFSEICTVSGYPGTWVIN